MQPKNKGVLHSVVSQSKNTQNYWVQGSWGFMILGGSRDLNVFVNNYSNQLRFGVVSNSGINLKNYCQKLTYHFQTPQLGNFPQASYDILSSNNLKIKSELFVQTFFNLMCILRERKRKKSCY